MADVRRFIYIFILFIKYMNEYLGRYKVYGKNAYLMA